MGSLPGPNKLSSLTLRFGAGQRCPSASSSRRPSLRQPRRLTLGFRESKQVPINVVQPASGVRDAQCTPGSSFSISAPELSQRPGKMEWQAQLQNHPAGVILHNPGSTFSWMRCLKAPGLCFKKLWTAPSPVYLKTEGSRTLQVLKSSESSL